MLVLNFTIIHNGNLHENICSKGSSGHNELTLIHVEYARPDSLIFAHVHYCTYLDGVLQQHSKLQFETNFLSASFLGSGKVALVSYFSCSELELCPGVAIDLNKLERLVQETTCIREPWQPLVVSLLRSNTTAQGSHGSLSA